MDFAALTHYVSYETLSVVVAVIVLTFVALRVGLSLLIALFLALLLTEPVLALIPQTLVFGTAAAQANQMLVGGGVFVALLILLQRLLPSDFISSTQFIQAFIAGVAVVVGALAVWAHSPLFMEMYALPASLAYWFNSGVTLFWIVGCLLVLGLIRRSTGWL